MKAVTLSSYGIPAIEQITTPFAGTTDAIDQRRKTPIKYYYNTSR
jgi:hypothetical protein